MPQRTEFCPPTMHSTNKRAPLCHLHLPVRADFVSVPTCIVPLSNLKPQDVCHDDVWSIQLFRLHCLRTPYCRTRRVCWYVSAAIDCRTITGHLCQKLLSLSTSKLNMSDLSFMFIFSSCQARHAGKGRFLPNGGWP